MSGSMTARDISGILGVTVRGVNKRSRKEDWACEVINKRGDKRFSISELPEDVRIAVLNARRKEDNPVAPSGGNSPTPLYNKEPLCQAQVNTALAKADLLRLYTTHLKKAAWGQKDPARTSFMTAYNSGIAYPILYEKIGTVSWKTIEGWKRNVCLQGDTLELADHRGYWRRGRRDLTDKQTEVLLRCTLHPNKPLISEAIRMARAVMETKEIANGHSDATYRRWIEDWKSKNHHIWTFSRKGAKAWNDECAFYIERDYSVINVGDIVVADGHVLNFEILNPWTGKPKRMVLIVWLDMKSSFPLGWEIMPTENTQAISAALRRAIMRLGKYPKVAYLDNGKAFSSRFFNGQDLEQGGFSGLFEQLGIRPIFAWPYHGQSKTVERFFGTFAELERWTPTYSGTSIEKKPPRMMRGEKLHRSVYQKLTRGDCITLEQAHRAVAAWFDAYTQRPQSGHLAGRAPIDLFIEEKGDGVDPAELRYLMLSQDIRTINRNGIYFLGQNYYHPELYGRKHPVTIRYDLQNKDSVLVFERGGSYLCEATQTEKAHPAASILGTDADRELLDRLIAHKKHQEKEASVLSREFLETEVLPETRVHLARIGLSPNGDGSKLKAEGSKQLPPVNEKQILADVAELEKYQQDDAAAFFDGLQAMSEMDRYEKLVEAEVRGWVVSKTWQAFMRYYEQTPEYERHLEYWEEHRVKAAYMYQAV